MIKGVEIDGDCPFILLDLQVKFSIWLSTVPNGLRHYRFETRSRTQNEHHERKEEVWNVEAVDVKKENCFQKQEMIE